MSKKAHEGTGPQISRRTALAATALIPIGFSLFGSGGAAQAVPSRQLLTALTASQACAQIRAAWKDLLIGGYSTSDSVMTTYVDAFASDAQSTWDSLNKSSGRTYLWSDLASTTDSSILRATTDRLRQLALALKAPGSPLLENTGLSADLVSAVDWFLTNKYSPATTKYDNWWDWQIGIPLRLNDVGVLLYDTFSTTELNALTASVSHFAPDTVLNVGAYTGANLVWNCSVGAIRGALSVNTTPLGKIPAALSPLFSYVTSGDGFYADGSFIQHTYFAYNCSYGASLFIYLSTLLTALAGTDWAATAAQLGTVSDWFQDSLRPFVYNGLAMDMVRGREISRWYSSDHQEGHEAIGAVLQLITTASAADALAMKQLAKHWITADTYDNFFTYDSAPLEQLRLTSIGQARALVQDASITAATESVGSAVYPSMARALHKRPAFAFGIAMATAKIHSYESINSENLHGWYSGLGATYLNLASAPGHFTSAYWPTVNPYRLPGTTVVSGSLANGASVATTNTWAGGAHISGLNAVGMKIQRTGVTLVGFKSWFCVDDVIFCLGSGITSTDARAVETTVENRNTGQSGLTSVSVNGVIVQATPNGAPTVQSATRAWISNVGGYVFPGGSTINVLREDRTGKWTDINGSPYSDATSYSRRYVTVWLAHGTNPSNASYEYVILPGATSAQTDAFGNQTDVQVVANSTSVHALTKASTNTVMANFWTDGAPTTAGITADKACSVISQVTGSVVTMAVADPTLAATTAITITFDRPALSAKSLDSSMTVVALSPALVVSVNPSGARGRTIVGTFNV